MNEKPKTPIAKDKPVPSAVDEWNRIVREAYAGDDDEDAAACAAILAASDEEIERQLREAGVDVEAEDAKAQATYDAMVAKLSGGT
jgi:hypothetical protein